MLPETTVDYGSAAFSILVIQQVFAFSKWVMSKRLNGKANGTMNNINDTLRMTDRRLHILERKMDVVLDKLQVSRQDVRALEHLPGE
jgi:hypothetical protein